MMTQAKQTTPRKIIQIAVTYMPRDDEVEGDDRLFALCDDGSVWIHVWRTPGEGDVQRWEPLVDIPQD
jgi:hypothetical protein